MTKTRSEIFFFFREALWFARELNSNIYQASVCVYSNCYNSKLKTSKLRSLQNDLVRNGSPLTIYFIPHLFTSSHTLQIFYRNDEIVESHMALSNSIPIGTLFIPYHTYISFCHLSFVVHDISEFSIFRLQFGKFFTRFRISNDISAA